MSEKLPTPSDVTVLRSLQAEGVAILATRRSHDPVPGVVMVISDTVDSSKAQTWFVRAKTVVRSAFGSDTDFYRTLDKLRDPDTFHVFAKAKAILDGALAEAERLCVATAATAPSRTGRKVFIVHGHDDGTKETVARFLERLQLTPIVLHEQASLGRTIIEKFEDHSADAVFAVVLLTPDDLGGSAAAPGHLNPRARQNVVFEHGFFVGALGRQSVVALRRGEVEIPSDLSGVLYIDMTSNWRITLASEMRGAGLAIDLNLAV